MSTLLKNLPSYLSVIAFSFSTNLALINSLHASEITVMDDDGVEHVFDQPVMRIVS